MIYQGLRARVTPLQRAPWASSNNINDLTRASLFLAKGALGFF